MIIIKLLQIVPVLPARLPRADSTVRVFLERKHREIRMQQTDCRRL
jgi:hypothetical protein